MTIVAILIYGICVAAYCVEVSKGEANSVNRLLLSMAVGGSAWVMAYTLTASALAAALISIGAGWMVILLAYVLLWPR